MLVASIALLHANADLLIGILVGVAIGLLVGPLLRAWLTLVEWRATSREADLTEALIGRLDRDLDDLNDGDEPTRDDDRTWRTSR